MEGFPSGALPLDPYHSFNCIGLECYSECKDVPLQGGGNLLDEAVFCYSGVSDTQPVMGLRPSLWGLYDLGGNVIEYSLGCSS